jgi:hypothetical protein
MISKPALAELLRIGKYGHIRCLTAPRAMSISAAMGARLWKFFSIIA